MANVVGFISFSGAVIAKDSLDNVKDMMNESLDEVALKIEEFGYDTQGGYELCRNDLSDFMFEYGFDSKVIVIDQEEAIAEDQISLRIFVAAASIMGTHVYDAEYEYMIEPDPVYLEVMGNIFKCRCSKNPLVSSEDSSIVRIGEKSEMLCLMANMWRQYKEE